MHQAMWYLTRSTGIVAAVLMVAALVWGFLFAARATGDRVRPAWWLDLHNWLGGLAVIFTGGHIAAAWLDSKSGIGWLQILVPGTATGRDWAITWGVVATYLTTIAVFTTWPRRLRARRWWRILHLGSVAATALALLHGLQAGSDAGQRSYQVGLILAIGVGMYPMSIRLLRLADARQRRASSRRSQPAHRPRSLPPDLEMAKSKHER